MSGGNKTLISPGGALNVLSQLNSCKADGRGRAKGEAIILGENERLHF